MAGGSAFDSRRARMSPPTLAIRSAPRGAPTQRLDGAMGSVFESFRRLSPAAFVLEAILAAVVADALLMGFILLRRAYRKRYFAKRDACVFEFRQNWGAWVSGKDSFEYWRHTPLPRRSL